MSSNSWEIHLARNEEIRGIVSHLLSGVGSGKGRLCGAYVCMYVLYAYPVLIQSK